MFADLDPDSRELVLTPQGAVRRSSVGTLVVAAGWLVGSAFYLLRLHGLLRVVMIAVDAAVVLGALVVVKRSYRRTKLALIGGRLVFTGLVRDRVVFADGRSGRVVEAEVDWGRASGRRSRLWSLVNADGRTEVSLNRDIWDAGQLESLRVRFGLPLDVVDEPLRPAEARKTYPGVIPWWAAHPVMATYLLIALIVAIVIAARGLA